MRDKTLKVTIEKLGYKNPKPPTIREALRMMHLRYDDLHKILAETGAETGSRMYKDSFEGRYYYFRLTWRRIDPQAPKSEPRLRHIITSRTKGITLTRDDEVYTVAELADLLRINRLTVLDLIKKGDLEAFTIGSSWRISGTALNEYVNRNLSRLKEAASGHSAKSKN